MKAPIADQSTPEISDEENENSVHFTDKARLTIPSEPRTNPIPLVDRQDRCLA